MTRKWFKRLFFDYKTIEQSSPLGKLRKYLHYSYLWHLDRESVARGVAVGLFAGIVPLIPFQTLMAIFLSIFLRANLPTAFLASWVSNPFTIIPITYFIYSVGNWILDKNTSNLILPHLSSNLTNLNHVPLNQWLYQFGKAFFVGLPIVSIGTALAGYVIVIITWYGIKFFKQRIHKN